MAKRKITVAECAAKIVTAWKPGLLLTSKAGDEVNSMAIGWGSVGRIWEKPVFVAYVRSSRHTCSLIDASGEFTVNIPVDGVDLDALILCGTKSGRDMDKVAAAGLTLVEPEVVSVPAVKEFPLTFECRVLYREEQDCTRLEERIVRDFYTDETAGHIAYYGEILASYLIED